MDNVCPICNETWDRNDSARFFYPCPCNFQMCSFCFNNLKKTSFRCPYCRKPYEESNFRHVDPKRQAQNKRRQNDQNNHGNSFNYNTGSGLGTYSSNGVSSGGNNSSHNNNNNSNNNNGNTGGNNNSNSISQQNIVKEKTQDLIRMNVSTSIMNNKVLHNFLLNNPAEDLKTVRVLQKNLVYVTGIPNDISDEQLKSSSMFGQYGRVIKLVSRYASSIPGLQSSIAYNNKALYVTYSTNEEAYRCIFSCHRTYFDGGMLNALYGTTKFCKNFLMGVKCTNPDCMYLHSADDSITIFTKSGMSSEMFKQKTQIDVFRTMKGAISLEGGGSLEYKHELLGTRETFESNKNQRERLPPPFDKKHEKTTTITQAPWSKRKNEYQDDKKNNKTTLKTLQGNKKIPETQQFNGPETQLVKGINNTKQGASTSDQSEQKKNNILTKTNEKLQKHDQIFSFTRMGIKGVQGEVNSSTGESKNVDLKQQLQSDSNKGNNDNGRNNNTDLNRPNGSTISDGTYRDDLLQQENNLKRNVECLSKKETFSIEGNGCNDSNNNNNNNNSSKEIDEDEKIVVEENTEDLLDVIFGDGSNIRRERATFKKDESETKGKKTPNAYPPCSRHGAQNTDASNGRSSYWDRNEKRYVQKEYNYRQMDKEWVTQSSVFSSFSIQFPNNQFLVVPLPFEVEYD